jgi:tetratricopeptide (TPR) repeat protein
LKRMRLRLTEIVLAVATASFVAGIDVACDGADQDAVQQRSASALLRKAELAKQRAEKARKEKNTKEESEALGEQIDSLISYLKIKPNDMNVREEVAILLADHVYDQQSFNKAYGNLEKLLRDDPGRSKARRKLTDLAILARRYDAALNELEKYLLKENPGDPKLLDQLGQCQEGTLDFDSAAKSYEDAIKKSPTQIETYVRLARLLQGRLKRRKEADEWMHELIRNNPNSTKAHVYLGNYLRGLGSNSEALKAAEKALQLSPDDEAALSLAAQCETAMGHLEQARKYAQRNADMHPDSASAYNALAEVLIRLNEEKTAIDVLDRGLAATRDSPGLLWSKANLLIEIKGLDEAKKTVQKLRASKYPKPLLEYLDAKMLFARKEWSESISRFEAVRPSLAAWPGLVMQADLCRAYCYLQLKDAEQAIAAYRQVLAGDPTYVPAIRGLADAYVTAGRVNEALEEYKKMIRMKAISPEGLRSFAGLLIRTNLGRQPADRKWEQVEDAIREAEKAEPDAFQICLLRVEALHAQYRDQEAEKLLREAIAKKPKQSEFRSVLAGLLVSQKKWDQAQQFLDDWKKQWGDSVELRLARADYLVERPGAPATQALRELNEKTEGFTDADHVRLWNGLLAAARRAGDRALIQEYLTLLDKKGASNLEVYYMRMEKAANSGDVAALEESIGDAEKVEGKGPLWLFGQARLSILKAKNGSPELLDEALDYLAQAQKQRPSWARIPLFMGSIYDLQNNPEQALRSYMRAVELGETNPAVVERVVAMLLRQKRYGEAEKLFDQLDKAHYGFSAELTHWRAFSLIQQGRYDQAVEQVLKASGDKSEKYGDYVWLGETFHSAAYRAKQEGRTQDHTTLAAQAEKHFRRAADLAGDVPETWISLVIFLNSIGKAAEAEQTIAQARSKLPAKKAPLALAQCYEILGKTAAANEQYKLALDAAPDDAHVACRAADFYERNGKRADAETILAKIVGGNMKAADADLTNARRLLAKIILAKGGFKNREAARDLIEKNLAAAPDSPDDLRLKAKLLAEDPGPDNCKEAIAILTKLVNSQQASAEDNFGLALLYLNVDKQAQAAGAGGANAGERAADAWKKADKILRQVTAFNEIEPRYLTAYAKALLDHGDPSGAETYINKLAKINPNTAATAILQAELLFGRSQFADALELLRKFVDRRNALPEDRLKRVRMMAETMEELAARLKAPEQEKMAERYLQSAEMLYRQYISARPAEVLDLVSFFERQGQIDNALTALEQTWEQSDPASVAQICRRLARGGKGPADVVSRVEKVLNRARMSAKFNDHPAVILVLGEFAAGRDRFADAENYCREILNRNPRYYQAMNNLALLLAMQGKNLDEALETIDRAIDITGPTAAMLDTRTLVYVAKGDAQKALADINQAVAEDPTPARFFHQAQAFLSAGKTREAASAMQKALKAGLSKDDLYSPEVPQFEKLQKLAHKSDAATGKTQ